jgi:aminoglycoside phosphotransferase (APT) family kinase protein
VTDAHISEANDKPELGDIRPGEDLDWDALVPYLRNHIPGLEGDFAVKQFPNGSANLTYLLQFGATRLVLRRPPFGKIAPGAHDMRREYRVLSKLWEHFPPAPRAYHLGTDPDVIGSDFIVMEYRSGEVAWGRVPASMAHLPQAGRRMGFAVVDALADLHSLDPATSGLGDLGRPEGFVKRQVEGWTHRWTLVAAEAESPIADQLMTATSEALAAGLPDATRVSVLHNDYKLDNCQFRPGEPDQVNSVFDWDMATVGDPLIDLGTLLNYWPDPSDTPDDQPLTPLGLDSFGLPARAEVVERYGDRTGINVDLVAWYEAFACFKTAVVLQQLYARWKRGETNDSRMAERGAWVLPMARRSERILGRLSE